MVATWKKNRGMNAVFGTGRGGICAAKESGRVFFQTGMYNQEKASVVITKGQEVICTKQTKGKTVSPNGGIRTIHKKTREVGKKKKIEP